ncbi:hypothetical protein SAE02_51200 [Skermanella aerolata]|uniref:DUF3306 domain-containing protein n=1 Tax=Skermanella aerolata TaxID=393310 RepID=A0A512DWY8_9PROT|nr:DUF3306 domain-containing protein [Skermanella aerolata]KJB93757.1 hypothetical protein N826_14535 [Skermanella aerolata KACC 11604]GEO40972.1 hypothetical protein SAE02_51200 [Skermanella aerolata]
MKTKTEDEGFLGRWARLKRTRAAEVSEPAAEIPEVPEAEPEPFDPASLPALDTLDAVSDYTAFLKPGVPRELRTMALRRAWATDPAITGYKTLADYDWDFNAPGYGALRVTDNVKELADRVFGLLKAEEPEPKPEPDEPEVPEAEASVVEVAAVEAEPEPERLSAPVEEPVAEVVPELPRRRRHGGAVPSFS